MLTRRKGSESELVAVWSSGRSAPVCEFFLLGDRPVMVRVRRNALRSLVLSKDSWVRRSLDEAPGVCACAPLLAKHMVDNK